MRRALLALLVLLAACGPASAGASLPESVAESFREGTERYQEGDYAAAAVAWERVLSLGYTAPELEFNLGNAHLKAGSLGAAILHYRRALEQDPGYENARVNLEYARGLTRDVHPELGGDSFWSWVARLRLGPAAAAAALFLSLTLFLLLAALRRIRGGDRLGPLLAQGVLAGLVLLAAGALVFEWSQVTGRHEGVLVVDQVGVRAGPGEGQTVSFRLHEGTEVELLRSTTGWRELRVSERLQGWVPESAVAEI